MAKRTRILARNYKKPETHAKRLAAIGRQLDQLGRVGGIRDKRLDSIGAGNNRNRSEAEVAMQKNVIERLRHLERLSFDQADLSDPLIAKAAKVNCEDQEAFEEFDKDEVMGIQESVVDQDFFTDADTRKSSTAGPNFHDTLAEKIANTKLERIKRVEENEEQRERLQAVDSEWSSNIRHLLPDMPIKSKKRIPDKVEGNKSNIDRLLDSIDSDQRIGPADSLTQRSKSSGNEKAVLRLQEVVKRKASEFAQSDEQPRPSKLSAVGDNEEDMKKNPLHLLRISLQMPNHEQDVLVYIATQLSLSNTLKGLKDVVKHLYLINLVLDHAKRRLEASVSKIIIDDVNSSSGFLLPEAVHALARLLATAKWKTNNQQRTLNQPYLLTVKGMDKLDESALSNLDLNLSVTSSSYRLTRDQMPRLRLACLNHALRLTSSLVDLYASHLDSATACQLLYKPLTPMLANLNLAAYPLATDLSELVAKVTLTLERIPLQPPPHALVKSSRLDLLRNEPSLETYSNVKEDRLTGRAALQSRAMKQLGLLPQLEPRFEEKLLARGPKRVDCKSTLKRRVANEKRGARRDFRRDSQYIASHQLRTTKASDKVREQKTQAILKSMRSIED